MDFSAVQADMWDEKCPSRGLHVGCRVWMLAVCGVLLATCPAVAEEEGYSYEFEAEFLDGHLLQGDGPRIVQRPSYPFGQLIRPRLSYVRELVKSVENL